MHKNWEEGFVLCFDEKAKYAGHFASPIPLPSLAVSFHFSPPLSRVEGT